VNVYLGEEDIRFLQKEATPIGGGRRAHHRAVHRRGCGVSELPELTSEEIGRYSRHLILEEVGVEGQRKLKGAKVLCIGSGGLGSPLLLYLAAAGVGPHRARRF
jgi:hypothetical protein